MGRKGGRGISKWGRGKGNIGRGVGMGKQMEVKEE